MFRFSRVSDILIITLYANLYWRTAVAVKRPIHRNLQMFSSSLLLLVALSHVVFPFMWTVLLATKCTPFRIFPIEYSTNWWISLDFSRNWFCLVDWNDRKRRKLTFHSGSLFSLAKHLSRSVSDTHSICKCFVVIVITVHLRRFVKCLQTTTHYTTLHYIWSDKMRMCKHIVRPMRASTHVEIHLYECVHKWSTELVRPYNLKCLLFFHKIAWT